LVPVLDRFPTLRVVMEHITTQEGAEFAASHGERVGATITPQHLLFNRNALFEGGLRPHLYCLPILKRERHQRALRAAAVSGSSNYFLGTDSAPHIRRLKEADCGCAGVFSAPVAVEAYLKVFAEDGALDRFEAFASLNGPAFYGFPASETRVTYVERGRDAPRMMTIESGELVPIVAGGLVDWSPQQEQ